ncbi:WD40 repeat-containing protein [Nitzschia inconspicua]|uniref:non-specific serine/threonine protein kinase n=1 Tax=Nitzschia inconspicua TaxID=303405 RepID=A0A9K3LZB2_9STRA|nr:WD40 repeat-containing protein [Nitzschia inconspicua]
MNKSERSVPAPTSSTTRTPFKTEPTDRSLPPQSVFNRSFLAVSTVDGNISVVNAQTGEQVSVFTTGAPLVGPSEPLEGNRRIVPGLDGRLYISSEDGLLKPLEIKVTDVLANPVKTCKRTTLSTEDEMSESTIQEISDCGIVTATKTTSLYALDTATGNLVWCQHPNGTTTRTDIRASATVLLQREDVLVQQVSTETGLSIWNVTVGTIEALQFGETPATGDLPLPPQGLLPSGSPISGREGKSILLEEYLEDLPHIVFSEDGTTLSAIDPSRNNGQRLWRQNFPTIISSIFGLNGKNWESLRISEEERDEDSETSTEFGRLMPESTKGLVLYRSSHLNQYLKPFQTHSMFNDGGRLAYGDYEYGRSPWLQDASSIKREIGKGVTSGYLSISSSSSSLVNNDVLPVKRLELPSPEMLELPRQGSDSLRYDGRGVYFAWPILVACVLCAAGTAIAVGRHIYKKKKIQWVRRATVSFDLNSIAKYRSTSEGSVDDHHVAAGFKKPNAKMLLRSHSLPGKMDDIVDRIQYRESPALVGAAASISPPTLTLSNEDQRPMETSSSCPDAEKPLPLNRSNTEASASQGVGLIDGTIPLIQYSRYASEFEELGALGKGGFGSVFQCKNALDGRNYAIKKVRIRRSAKLSQAEFSRQLQRTLREVKSLALLDHPNIVRYYTAWLELDQDVTEGNYPENVHGSDYYLMSPSTADHRKSFGGSDGDSSESSTSWQGNESSYQHNAANPKNGSHIDESISVSCTFDHHIPGVPDALDDYGFVFDRSDEEPADDASKGKATTGISVANSADKQSPLLKRKGSSSVLSRSQRGISFQSLVSNAEESSSGWSKESRNQSEVGRGESQNLHDEVSATIPSSVRYILYIQMQFCSQKTLADFLANEEARKGPSKDATGVDIPHALDLFLQIMKGVKHVHNQGLIHRDLKPNNCFIDDSGVVKVGDFGLSRESSDTATNAVVESILNETSVFENGDITAGVGTRSYASPEQIKGGTEYDSSTDVYSLGIILFELCYPMYTGMERTIVLSELRNHHFPEQWTKSVQSEFPSLHTLLLSMISNKPEDRPCADEIVQGIRSILEGFTISSLDKHDHDGAILLRVETEPREDVLRYTMDLVREAALPVSIDIVQYGLRGGSNRGQMKSIMEFAIVPHLEDDNGDTTTELGSTLVSALNQKEEVLVARQVSASKY